MSTDQRRAVPAHPAAATATAATSTSTAATSTSTSAAVAPAEARPTAAPAAPTPAAPRERTAGFVLLVGLLTLLPAITTDMYLPSLPDVASDLRTTAAAAQFTITGMLLGGAVGQLVVGPWSDRVGRRRPVLVGVGVHVVLSLLCVVAQDIVVLSALRVGQGLASAGATVVAMAIIRDRYTGADAARLMSRLMLVIAVAPLLAPTAGSVIAEQWDWRAVFVALALLAALLWLVVLRFLPETHPPERRATHGMGAAFRGYGHLVRDRRFMALAVLPGLSMGVVMSYVAGSPFVFQEQYGLSARQFALLFALNGLSMVVGSQTNAALVRRVGPARLLRTALPVGALLGTGLVTTAATGAGGVVGLLAMIWLTMATIGFVMSNASALALSRHGDRAGTAAATIGFLQAGVAGVVSPVVGLVGGDAVAMTSVMLASLVTGLLVLALATPAYRRDGWIALADHR